MDMHVGDDAECKPRKRRKQGNCKQGEEIKLCLEFKLVKERGQNPKESERSNLRRIQA